MKNNVKSIAIKAKNHVATHKAAYVAGAVAITAIALQQRNVKDFYKFLEEKGLDPEEFYSPETYAEKNN